MGPFWDGSPHLPGKCRLVAKLGEPERASPHLDPKVQQMQCLCCTGTVRQHRHCVSWGSGKLVSRVCAEVHDLGLKRSMRRRRSAQMGGEMGGGAPRRPKKGGGAPRRSKMGGGARRRPKMGGGAPRRPVKKQSTQNPPMLLFNPKSRTSAQTLDTSLPEPQLTQCLC